MPFLRQEPDNTLGETLGNLGSALGNALNPMNQIRANDMMAQIQQRRWEILQQQRIDASNQNAATVFRNANPLGMDPASLEATATQIGQGKYDPSQWVTATTGLAKQRAAQAASDAVVSDPEVQSFSPAEQASVQSLVLNGTSLADAKSQVATERANANKTNATITATGAATSPFAKEAAANNQPDVAVQIDTANNLENEPPITGPLGGADTQAQLDKRMIQRGVAKIPVTADMPISSGEAGNVAVKDITGKTIVAQAAPRAPDQIVPAVAPVDVLTGQPVGPGATTPGFQQTAQGPDTQAITQSKSAATAADEGTKFRATDIASDMESGRKANDMLRTVALMRQYSNLLGNDAPLGQLSMAFVQRVKDELGVTLDPSQSARNAFEQLGNSLIAETHKDDGVLRVAGPELSFFSRTLPNAQQDRPSLMRALDNLEIKARNLIAVGRKARDVYGATGGNVDAASYTGYTAARDKILAPPTIDQPVGTADKTKTSDTKTTPPPAGPRVWTKNADGTMSPPPD